MYLEAIFTGSADIRNLLPVETSRFGRLVGHALANIADTVGDYSSAHSINAEFLGLLKKAGKSPLVMDILSIPNIQVS